jgi:DNA-binding transcriptional ArsR family regulator
MVMTSSPFGSQTRTRVLVALRLLDESYPRELARLLDTPLNGVQMAVRSLARDGLIAARSVGRSQLVRLSPSYFARRELQAFLSALAAADSGLQRRVALQRRRPRQPGKPR